MKCNNCGVNYDDGDRECPMCGTPAGAGKKRAMPHYTEYGHTDHTDGSCTHRTYTQKYTSKQPARTQQSGGRPKAGSPKATLIVIVAIVIAMLLPVVPEILRDVRQTIEEIGWSVQHGTAEAAPESDDYDYTANRVAPAEVLGDSCTIYTGEGVLTLTLDGEDNYTLLYDTADWSYNEAGWAWCVYNAPEEELYEDIYTPDQYDSYSLCLDFDRADEKTENHPEALAGHMEQGEMWLLFYVSQADGTVVLDDAYGEAAAFFGGDQFLPLQATQKG